MKTLEDIIKLCKEEQGKIFVMDEKGDIGLVIMGMAEYHRMKSAEVGMQNGRQPVDPEVVNREILKAQLAEGGASQGLPLATKGSPWQQSGNPYRSAPPPEIRSNGLAKQRDMREEVIDPSFDFDAPEEI